ncbi:MAG: DUF2167 domain-containing protein [Verrucomicrobiota bacterium JB023]|nr:DUF2167 domain-containing protein [Verrucomicrobiota bacterium JB023]
MNNKTLSSLFSAGLFLAPLLPLHGQDEMPTNPVADLDWQSSGTGELGSHATLEIPEGYLFIEGDDTRTLMELFGNPATHTEQGLIAPPDIDWFIVFEFDDIGYVKDDEKDDIDADELLKSLQENDKYSNEARVAAGYDELNTVGWAVEPNYNEESNSLEWGLILESPDGAQSVNFLTKKLGRYGVMDVTIVSDPEDLESVLPLARDILTGFEFKSGSTYAEYEEGDKLAEYGLTALIAGGAALGAAKLGLFAKLGKILKPLALGLVAVGVAVKKFFGKFSANKA